MSKSKKKKKRKKKFTIAKISKLILDKEDANESWSYFFEFFVFRVLCRLFWIRFIFHKVFVLENDWKICKNDWNILWKIYLFIVSKRFVEFETNIFFHYSKWSQFWMKKCNFSLLLFWFVVKCVLSLHVFCRYLSFWFVVTWCLLLSLLIVI